MVESDLKSDYVVRVKKPCMVKDLLNANKAKDIRELELHEETENENNFYGKFRLHDETFSQIQPHTCFEWINGEERKKSIHFLKMKGDYETTDQEIELLLKDAQENVFSRKHATTD